MDSIRTKYIGPTNYRGSRVVAATGDVRPSTGRPDRLVMSWRDDLDSEGNHKRAAEALARKLGWYGSWAAGYESRGWTFVNVTRGGEAFVVRPAGAVLAAAGVTPELKLARAVLEWAAAPGEHGGNPYLHEFVKLARKLLGDE